MHDEVFDVCWELSTCFSFRKLFCTSFVWCLSGFHQIWSLVSLYAPEMEVEVAISVLIKDCTNVLMYSIAVQGDGHECNRPSHFHHFRFSPEVLCHFFWSHTQDNCDEW